VLPRGAIGWTPDGPTLGPHPGAPPWGPTLGAHPGGRRPVLRPPHPYGPGAPPRPAPRPRPARAPPGAPLVGVELVLWVLENLPAAGAPHKVVRATGHHDRILAGFAVELDLVIVVPTGQL